MSSNLDNLPEGEYKYWAFISYSHADQAWADWLHKALETYGVPKVLVGKQSKTGVVPKRAYPIFRDRDELPSSSDLGDKLTEALRLSRFLIVICSPRAVASRWVNEEIKNFKSLGRESRVLCLIVDGEPYASDHPELGLEECFPEPVRYRVDSNKRITGERTEPIAADARKGKDGRQNARLKLLAGMFGVNFSDLKQRDHERAQRRMQLILTGTGVMLMVFIGLAGQAILERKRAEGALQDAEIQRAVAENNRRKAEKAADRAEEERKKADIARIAAVDAQMQEAKARNLEAKAKEEAVKANEETKQALGLAEQKRKEAESAREAEQKALLASRQAEKDARAAESLAQDEKRKADQRAREVAEALSVSYFNEAAKLLEEGKEDRALAYLAKSLRFDPSNTSVQARMISLLSERNWLLPEYEPIKHTAPVKAVALSSRGQLVTVSGKTAILADAATGAKTGTIEHKGLIRSARFSADGSRLVTASDDSTARVWDTSNCQPVGKAVQHKGTVYMADFNADGKLVVTASHDNTARVSKSDSGDQVAEVKVGNRIVWAAFSPDSKHIVITSESMAQVHDAASGALVGQQMAHQGGVEYAVFSPDNKNVVTASGDKTAQIWDAATGNKVGEPMKHDDWVNRADFSPDGTFVVTASADKTVSVWDAKTSKRTAGPMTHAAAVMCAELSPNLRWILTGSKDRTVALWDTFTGKAIAEPQEFDGSVSAATFSPNGRRVAVASEDQTVEVFTTINGRPVNEAFRHDGYVTTANFSADGAYLITGSDDRTAQVWDVATGQPVNDPIKSENRVSQALFSPNGELILVVADRSVRLYERATGKPVGQPMMHERTVNTAVFSPNGKHIATACEDFQARVWDVAATKQVAAVKHTRPVRTAVFSADGKLMLTASLDKSAKIIEAENGKEVATITHEGDLRFAAFSKDGKYVIVGGDDRTARVWSTETRKPVTENLRHDGAVNAGAFVQTADGKLYAVTASEGREARIWDAITGKPAAEPLKHEGAVKDVIISRDGRLMVTVSRENVARIWAVKSWKPVAGMLSHSALVRSASFSDDGKYVVTSSEDKSAEIWLISLPGSAPEWLPALAESVGGYRLGEAGGTELVENSWNDISRIKGLLGTSSMDDPFVRWGNWFLADRTLRSISPFSNLSVTDYVKRRVEDGSPAALAEALDLRPDSGMALGKLAILTISKNDKSEGEMRRADYLSRLASNYEPENPDVLWMRGYVLQVQTNLEPSVVALEKALSLDPRHVKAFGPEGADFKSRNREGNRSEGWLPKGWTDESSAGIVGAKYSKTDAPPVGGAAVRSETTGTRDPALLRGPRYLLKRGQKATLSVWMRSDKIVSVTVNARSFLGPQEKYGEQFIRPTAEWKEFKIPLSSVKDTGAEVWIQIPPNTSVDIGGVKVE